MLCQLDCKLTHNSRRTGQSGPLGELFDHCIDAMNTTLGVIIFSSVAGFGYTWILIISQFATLTNFYLSTWEEYHTHKLFLSEFSGPVEGILSVVGLFIATGAFGSKIWQIPFQFGDLTLSFTDFYIIFGGLGLYFNIDSARKNVRKHYQQSNPRDYLNAIKGLLPFFVYYLSVFALIIVNPVLIEKYSIPLVLMIGASVAFSVGRIIVAHLTKQAFPYMTPASFLPTIILILNELLKFLGYTDAIKELIWMGLGLSFGFYGMFVIEIIYEITSYLDIYALSIKHPKKAS